MPKASTAETTALIQGLGWASSGAGMGFSWAATIVRRAGEITVERFTYLNWIAVAIMAFGLLCLFLAKRRARKAGHGQSQEISR